MTGLLRRLAFESREKFVVDGETRALRDPGGPPSGRQLRRLNKLGALALIEPGQAEPISAAQASGAIDELRRRDPFWDEP